MPLLQADLSMLGMDLAGVVKAEYQPRFERLEKLLAEATGSVLATRELLAEAMDRIAHLEARAPVPGPAGERGPRGEKGDRGDPGEAGPQGERGLDGAAGPAGERGDPGSPGEPGAPGANGEPGAPGEKGIQGDRGLQGEQGLAARDGRDGQPGRDGTDGTPGPAGRDGIDGKDGLGFEDLSVLFDGERTVTLRFARGDVVKDSTIVLAIPIDRGVWREGEYLRGDSVTWDGSVWIAQKDTSGKPGLSSDWRLSVKRGRDGKAGKDGKDGAAGPKGDRGEQGPRGFSG